MSYALEIYGVTDFSSVQTKLFTPQFTVMRWSKRMNAPGGMVFAIPKTSSKATVENLRVKRRVRLYRQSRVTNAYEAVWTGIIQDRQDVGSNREILCEGALAIFQDRLTGDGETFTGEGSTEAFGLLSDANSNGATGIIAGTGGVTTTRDVQTFGRSPVLQTLETLAAAHECEFEIDDEAKLNFVPFLGIDKSASVQFVYREDGELGRNLREINTAYSGSELVNQVYSSTTAGYTDIQTDAPSVAKYGLQEREITLNEALTEATLQSMTSTYLSQRTEPLPNLVVVPQDARKVVNPITGARSMSGTQLGDIAIGDLVSTTIITASEDTKDVVKRIAEIRVTVDEDGKESIEYTLSEAGVFVTASYLQSKVVDEIARRVKVLESAA